MPANDYQDVDDFLKFSMNSPDSYDEEIPEMLKDIDREHQENKKIREEMDSRKQGIIPPLGIAKPELVESFLNNMNDENKILEAVKEAERYENESPWESIGREAGSYAARGAEAFFGGIGSLMNLLTPELYESDEGIPFGEGERPKGFPDANELREITKEKTGRYLEPKNERQKIGQEYSSDVGSMFSLPFLGPIANILLPAAGQAAKQSLKFSGANETQQDIGKLGIMGIASLANLGNARGVSIQAMNAARDMIPTGLQISAGPSLRALNNIRNQSWWRTGSTPSKAPAMQMVERIENQIGQNGTLNLRDAMQIRRDINEARKGLGAFNIPPITDRRSARAYLDQVDRALLDSMENYGARVNPQWWHDYNLANQAFGLTERTGKMAELIEKTAKPFQSDMAKILFHSGAGALASGVGLGGTLGAVSGIAGAGAIAGQTVKLINRMARSPILRRHYNEVLRATTTGQANVIQKALKDFDKAALKYEYPKEKSQKNVSSS